MPHVIEKTVWTFDELSDRAKEKARDKWREHHLDYDWWEFAYEDAERAAECLGIELDHKMKNCMDGKQRPGGPTIWFSGFSSQGDGACFEGSYRYRKGWRKALKAYAPKDEELRSIGETLQEAQRGPSWAVTARIKHSGRYMHSGCMSVDVEIPDSDTASERERKARDAAAERCADLMSEAMNGVTDPVAASAVCANIKRRFWDEWERDYHKKDDSAIESIEQAMRDFADWIYKSLEREYDYQMADEQIDESIRCNEMTFNEDGSVSR